jgi:transposase-like protein
MMNKRCDIVSVGKRRDGGTRYWCLEHRADATAKYGVPQSKCRYADLPALLDSEIVELDLTSYDGGVALWGAVPPIYDTTQQPLDRGIHVHARPRIGSSKEIDATFRRVRLTDSRNPKKLAEIAELDAIYYMVSSIFGYSMDHVECTRCSYSHLDKDWFSLHAHKRHLCAGCGQYFTDTKVSIGNPIVRTQKLFDVVPKPTSIATKTLEIRQSDYPGGVQIWGSNPSIFWTGDQHEEEGIHVHVFNADASEMIYDDTFSRVTIDDISLDPLMVRILMAQKSLPHILQRLVSINCPSCKEGHFDVSESAFTAKKSFVCRYCDCEFPSRGRLRNVVSNPLIGVLTELSKNAPRLPQNHKLDLLPETL